MPRSAKPSGNWPSGFSARDASETRRAKLRAAAAAVAGILVCLLALLVLWLVWPHTHLYGSFSEIDSWKKVAVVALANSLAAITAYLAVAALIWGFADAAMAQPRTLRKFAEAPKGARTWRIVHLSDIHVVGERLRLPRRERQVWPARQRPATAPARTSSRRSTPKSRSTPS